MNLFLQFVHGRVNVIDLDATRDRMRDEIDRRQSRDHERWMREQDRQDRRGSR